MKLRVLLATMLVLILCISACKNTASIVDYGNVPGNVVVHRSDDDVSMFSYPPNQEVIASMSTDENELKSNLEELVRSKRYNYAAYLSAHVDDRYNKFVIEWIKNNINELPPPFMYVLARKYDVSDTETALYWDLRGFVLSKLDAKLCLDKSAGQGARFMGYIIGDKLKAKHEEYKQSGMIHKGIIAAFDYARAYEPTYTPMWICSHGMSSFMEGGNKGFLPKDKRMEQLDILEASYRESTQQEENQD